MILPLRQFSQNTAELNSHVLSGGGSPLNKRRRRPNLNTHTHRSVCAGAVSDPAGFHTWSSVSWTFSKNCLARTVARSKHSASWSKLRRSILIRSTGHTRQQNKDQKSKQPYKEERVTFYSVGVSRVKVFMVKGFSARNIVIFQSL